MEERHPEAAKRPLTTGYDGDKELSTSNTQNSQKKVIKLKIPATIHPLETPQPDDTHRTLDSIISEFENPKDPKY